MQQRIVNSILAILLSLATILGFDPAHASNAARAMSNLASWQSEAQAYIRPEFARQIQALRPAILASARRHNRPEVSHMSDQQFAVVIALLLYNEHFGWLEEELPPLRLFTPLYQATQVELNLSTGSNFTVWPANLRPSVAVEILNNELPGPAQTIQMPLMVTGSQIDPHSYTTRQELYAAVTAEITRPEIAVEYLAANLERGVARARLERVPVTWQVLAAWHNQGIVQSEAIERNPTARDYIRRAAGYLPAAEALITGANHGSIRTIAAPATTAHNPRITLPSAFIAAAPQFPCIINW